MELRYPIGVETFSKIREEGCVYVDKTEIIYKLTQFGQYIFLGRPRRFGKSLMLSTMEAYFEGRKELFDDLWLGQADGVEWTPRPVLRLNFVDAECSVFGLESLLKNHLIHWEAKYGLSDMGLNYGQRFRNVIAKAHETSGQKVVVLIDEYDKVLVNSLHNEALHEELKDILKPVFGVLKGADRYLRFVCLTGVSRFSRLSIFSDLNNLQDISLNNKFSTICGFTEDEIRTYLRDGVQAFADEEDIDFEKMMTRLKDNYDGYHFSDRCPDIYNPFSVLSALSEQKLAYYWFSTGTPSFLVKKIRNADYDIRDVFSPKYTSWELANTDSLHSNLINLLFQTGYLTIKDYDREDDVYTLGIPNKEVESNLFESLMPMSENYGEPKSMLLIRFRDYIRSGEPEKFMQFLQSFLAGIPYDHSKKDYEIFYENNLYIIFKMLGFFIQTEYRTSEGRIDILMTTPKFIYVFELKLNGTAAEAMEQIKNKNYTLPFFNDDRRIFRIGIGFSHETRNIKEWIIE